MSKQARTTRFRQNLCGAVGVGVAIAVGLVPATAVHAQATEACGFAVSDSYTADVNGLQQLLDDGHRRNVDILAEAVSLSRSLCVPTEKVTRWLGEEVVGGHLFRFAEVDGVYKKILVAFTEESLRNTFGDQTPPIRLPAVGAATFPVAFTGGIGVNLRPEPTRTGRLAGIPDGTPVTIECTTHGEAVTGQHGTTTVWDRITYENMTGYVSDQYINTGTDEPVAPAC